MDNPAQVAADRLAAEMASWKSIELQVRQTYKVQDESAAPGIDRVEYHYVETPLGQRLADVRTVVKDGTASRASSYCDGKRCANVAYAAKDGARKQQFINVVNKFMKEDVIGDTDRPIPLWFYYVGKVPINEALPAAKHLGPSRNLGRDCERFLFPHVRWAMLRQDIVYHLDKATSVPLRFEAYRDGEALQNQAPAWVWKATSLDRVQGHSLPLHSEMVIYDHKTGAPNFSQDITVELARYDAPHAASEFWPAPEPGVMVFDGIEKTETRTPGGPARDFATKAGSGLETTTGAPPIRAVPSWDWSQALSTTSLGLGIVILATALLTRWRRR